MSKTFASTNISHYICKNCVLTCKFDSSMLEYCSDTRATDDFPEVRVYMSSIWIYRRGLTIIISHITSVSHNYKLQMCPGEAFVDMAVAE